MTRRQSDPAKSPSPSSSPRPISSEGLTALLESSPDALLLVNQAGAIVAANDLAATCFGYTESALPGLLLERLLPPRFRQSHRQHLQRYFADPHTRPMGVN